MSWSDKCRDCRVRYAQEMGLCRRCQSARLAPRETRCAHCALTPPHVRCAMSAGHGGACVFREAQEAGAR